MPSCDHISHSGTTRVDINLSTCTMGVGIHHIRVVHPKRWEFNPGSSKETFT